MRRILLRFFATDQGVYLFRRRDFFELLFELGIQQQAADAGQGLDVRTGLIRRRNEQDDDLYRFVVDAVKFNRVGRDADGHNQFFGGGTFAVRNGDARTDAGAADYFFAMTAQELVGSLASRHPPVH